MQLSKKLIGSLPYRMSKLVTLPMSSFASRAFEMARRSSLPSPPSISFSG
jgi:hypothetical protein